MMLITHVETSSLGCCTLLVWLKSDKLFLQIIPVGADFAPFSRDTCDIGEENKTESIILKEENKNKF